MQKKSPTHPAIRYADSRDSPLGMIPRMEPQWSHERVFEIVKPAQVMVKIENARRIAKRNETAQSYFHPDTTVITTTTTDDAELAKVTRDHEWEVLKAFQPDYHIPADHSVYKSLSESKRVEREAKCLSGMRWVRDKLQDNSNAFRGDPPEILPLIKGVTPEERAPFIVFAQNIGAPTAVFYAAQYITGGWRLPDLVDDLNSIDENAADELPITLIGLLQSERLDELPNRVVASAGFSGWFKHIAPRKDPPEEVSEAYQTTAEAVHKALNTPNAHPISI